MPSSSGLLLYPPASTIIRPSNRLKFRLHPLKTRKFRASSPKCHSSSSSSSITDLDLYDLLGIESSSDQSQVKMAYRLLQKRCHPDIAGTAGHDMAIILNQAYSILSDPNSRSAYDKEQAKIEDFRGYTGQPLYSTWFGSESEERAVFVDEVRCVGCLKCALFAEKTFAIESIYGRARVVGQWADPEQKIQDAIQACPVDCISVVERSNLAALEFLMSKQPRGNVKVGTGNSVGTCVSNIFADIKKFQSRYEEAKNKSSKTHSRGFEEMMSAILAIRSTSNWLYWHSPKTQAATTQEPSRNLALIAEKATHPSTDKLREAAAARQMARENVGSMHDHRISLNNINKDQYWTPLTTHIPPSPTCTSNSEKSTETSQVKLESEVKDEVNDTDDGHGQRNPWKWAFPMVTATFAAVIVRLQGGGNSGGGSGLEDHIAGSLALHIVNSLWLQTILAGVTWYLIGIAALELVEIIRKGNVKNRADNK